MRGARWRLLSFGVAQAARGLADGCLARALLLALVERDTPGRVCVPGTLLPIAVAAWLVGTAVGGSFCLRHGARRVLLAAFGGGAAAVILGTALPGGAALALALVAVAAGFSGAARDALLPAVGRAAGWPLPRLLGTLGLVTASAAAGGVLLGTTLALPDGDRTSLLSAAVALAAYGLALLAALASRLPAPDRPAKAATVVRGRFLAEGRRLFRHPDTLDPLVAQAGLVALVLAGCAVAFDLPPAPGNGHVALPWLVWVCLGAGAGSLLAGCQSHPSRVLSTVPLAVTGFVGALLWRAHVGATAGGDGLGFFLGMTAALAAVPLAASYLTYLPDNARGIGVAWLNLAVAAFAGLALGLVDALERLGALASPAGRFGTVAALGAVGAAAAWWAFFRDFAERVTELLLRPCYRVRAHGPGTTAFPLRGPVLVLANHAAWLDALWVATVLPRRVVPLMISLFYDRPVLHWLMSRVIRAIRVQDTPYRREAPELDEAVAALDRGDCVLIFPEGLLRRKDEVPLRHFGQGVWRILRARPRTPVVVCWIEGGWGSVTSHAHGPPLTGKPLDWRRPIDVAVELPQVLAPALLADQRATRHCLEQACLHARRHLGLEVPSREPVASET